MRDRLIWKGCEVGSELFYLAFPEAKHDENAWAARSPIPLYAGRDGCPESVPADVRLKVAKFNNGMGRATIR